MKKLILLTIIVLIICVKVTAQKTKRVLFLGNSYTEYSNLPQIVADIANSTGDTVIVDSNTPGGYTLEAHSTNATSLSQIKQGKWDFVVLQEQSQRPSLPIAEVQANTFPYARILDSIINKYNPCSETIFYMTWGRKFGDGEYCGTSPDVCTYEGMDSLLRLRYMTMAETNKALISPVSVAWKYIRQNYPLIELYNPDNSHPSLAGSYLAACCFYTAIFRKNPTLITNDYTLPPADAAAIRLAVKKIMYDSLLSWHIGEYDPITNFNFVVAEGNAVAFKNLSKNAMSYKWNFGDGNTSIEPNPTHTYATNGNYPVTLIATCCSYADTIILSVNATTIVIPSTGIKMYPNPIINKLTINVDKVDRVAVVNSMGARYIPSYTKNGQSISIDFSTLATGVYFIELTTNGKLITKKVVKR